MTQYILEFHWRSDAGPMRVGPFESVLDAELHVQRLADKEDVRTEWDIIPVFAPDEVRTK